MSDIPDTVLQAACLPLRLPCAIWRGPIACCRCTRAAFHDGGASAASPMARVRGVNKQTVKVWAGGFDASLVLTGEQLREENAYDRSVTPLCKISG